jgi:hypothetical protein
MVKRRLFGRLVASWLLLVLCLNAQAQYAMPLQPQLIADDIMPGSLAWSHDQSVLAFRDTYFPGGQVYNNDFDTWYRFDIDEDALSHGYIWPLQPAIPPQIKDLIIPGTLLFRSPSGRYYIFVAPTDEAKSWFEIELMVFDSLQRTAIGMDIPAGGITTHAGYLDVIWGTDTAFVMQTYPIEGGLPTLPILYYVKIQEGVASSRLIIGSDYEGQQLFVTRIFDVSQDGVHILLYGFLIGGSGPFLAVWNMEALDGLAIVAEGDINVQSILKLDAQFTADDGSEFVFIDDKRTGRYNLTTETASTISNIINGQAYRYAEFSPTGDRLALTDDTAVYWVDLASASNIPDQSLP